MIFGAMAVARPATAATITVTPGDNINSKINSMSPGDTLLLAPGIYTKASGTMMLITNKVGTASAWFVMRAAAPNTVKILGNSGQNMCEMRNSAYWRFENLEFDGRNLSDDGIKCTINTGNANTDWCHDIIIDTCHIHNLTNACVNTQVTVWNLTVQNCWLHDCNLAGYLGSPDHVRQMINLVFQHNLIERTIGYGVQVKAQEVRSGLTLGTTAGLEFTSWGWLIKDNVFMRTSPPATTGRPNLLVDAAPASGSGSDDLATIEGNVVLAQTADGTGDNAFQLSGNLRIVNNVLMNTKAAGLSAIRIGLHDSTYPRHLEIINNTVFIDGSSSARCLSLWDLQPGYTQVIANNAFIRGSTSAPAISNGAYPGTVLITNNLVRGTGAMPGMTTIPTLLSQLFVNPVDVPGTADLYPVVGSPLIGAGSSSLAAGILPTNDFNRTVRPPLQPVDVGAYRYCTATNPGWQLALDFKGFRMAGDVDGNHVVNVTDLQVMVASWGLAAGDSGYDTCADVDGNDLVNIGDLQVLVANWGNN